MSGDAANDWSYNFMSHGPQGCPGYGMSVFLGRAAVGAPAQRRRIVAQRARLSPSRALPYSLDLFGFRVRVNSAA